MKVGQLLDFLQQQAVKSNVTSVELTRAPSRHVAKLKPLPMTIRLFSLYRDLANFIISLSSLSTSLMYPNK